MESMLNRYFELDKQIKEMTEEQKQLKGLLEAGLGIGKHVCEKGSLTISKVESLKWDQEKLAEIAEKGNGTFQALFQKIVSVVYKPLSDNAHIKAYMENRDNKLAEELLMAHEVESSVRFTAKSK